MYLSGGRWGVGVRLVARGNIYLVSGVEYQRAEAFVAWPADRWLISAPRAAIPA
jgi:hypothetical protein